MVVLDIGGDIGALVISMPSQMIGAELEICPAGQRHQPPDDGAGWWPGDWHDQHEHRRHHDVRPAWPHVAVLNRPTLRGMTPAAVFPGLRAGSYEIWPRPNGPTRLHAEIRGGSVNEAAWPLT